MVTAIIFHLSIQFHFFLLPVRYGLYGLWGQSYCINVVHSLIIGHNLHDKSAEQLWYIYEGRHSGPPLKAFRLFQSYQTFTRAPDVASG